MQLYKGRTTRSLVSRSALVAGSLVATTSLLLAGCGSKASDTEAATAESCVDTSGSTVKVGSLNSLSGTMAISEVTVRDAIKLAVDEINAAGGVLGKQIQIVGEDGASEPTGVRGEGREADQQRLRGRGVRRLDVIEPQGDAAGVRGATTRCSTTRCSTRASSRRQNIFYTGATTNQQIVPALDYLKEKGVKSLYLVGSDYVFPQTANRIIKAYAGANGIEINGEDYTPLGSTDFSTIVNKVAHRRRRRRVQHAQR